jgi:hypothetical protein
MEAASDALSDRIVEHKKKQTPPPAHSTDVVENNMAAGNMAVQRAANSTLAGAGTVDAEALFCVPSDTDALTDVQAYAQTDVQADSKQSIAEPASTSSVAEHTSTPAAPTIKFDVLYPWLFSAEGNTDDLAIIEELYGPGVSMPLRGFNVPKKNGFSVSMEKRYFVVPSMLRDFYYMEYEHAMTWRRIELDSQLARDVIEIKYMPLTTSLLRISYEGKVIDIMKRWASEPFPAKPNYLDRLFAKLSGITFDTGWIATSWTNLYSYILNHFSRADEVRAIRDEYSQLFAHEEAIPEAEFWGTGNEDFFGMFWNDVKSGAVASRIGNYFKGLGQAGIGLLKGLHTLITDPGKVIEALGNLPGTLKTLWRNRGILWDNFVNASPDEQARMIGRLFGEIEVLIATAGAGSGGSAAAKSPQLASAIEVVGVSRSGAATAALGGGASIPIDLGVLGTEGARMTSLMAMTSQGATSGKGKAEELSAEQNKPPVEETKKPATEPENTTVQKELARKEYDQLSQAERNAYTEKWMKERGITRIEFVNDHHAWPKYLGGPENGPLISLDERLHQLFHAGLDKILSRRLGGEHFAHLSEAEKIKNINMLKNYARDFDIDYYTKIYDTLMKAFKGTPYE